MCNYRRLGQFRDVNDTNEANTLPAARVPPSRVRLVLHCDLDSFFASVEQAARPELTGKPVAVSAARGQSVITAASYEAKRHGVKVGVPLRVARQLCPGLLFLPARMEAYQRCGAYVHDIIRSTGARIETLGLDECFLRLEHVREDLLVNPGRLIPDSDSPSGRLFAEPFPHNSSMPVFEDVDALNDAWDGSPIDPAGDESQLSPEVKLLPTDPYERAEVVATWIRATVYERTGLRITVGVGTNKTVAKLASDSAKPDGLMIVRADQELAFLHRTRVEEINGIGPRSVMKLHNAGLTTVGDVANITLQTLTAMLGKRQGKVIHAISHNIFDEGVTPNPKPKTTSSTRSFGAQGHNALEALDDLLAEVLLRLANSGRSARWVGVFAADPSTIYQARHDVGAPTADLRELAATARVLMTRIPPTFHANIAGVTLDGLSDSEQLRLGFDVGWLQDPDLAAPVIQRPYDAAEQLQRCAYRGMAVHHPDFGVGIVEALATQALTIRFHDRPRVLEYWTPLHY